MNKQAIVYILRWAQQFPYVCYFNPQQTENYPNGTFTHQLAIGHREIKIQGNDHFNKLKEYLNNHQEQKLYGYFSYDLKNELEKLESNNPEEINWEPMGFFEPDCIFHFHGNQVIIESEKVEFYQKELDKIIKNNKTSTTFISKKINPIIAHTSRKAYLETVNILKQHIVEGDIYEINYCINFSTEIENFDPIREFLKLSEHSPTPFSSLLKWEEKYVLCASPERFIKLEDGKIISQPIKGTARRSEDPEEDYLSKLALSKSEKEQAENMMIVDLVRNDLAKSAMPGSVKVDEFFGIYSFRHVHQMISTISALPKDRISSVDIIRNAFPMGSMTGAPKIRAMQLIEKYETTKRNIFSGSIGYFNGLSSFDFNVVIRSIFYNQQSGKLHYQVGSAITHDSVPEEEYEECLLKAHAIQQVLSRAH
ncbi:anthranilate synthase component I family protein [Marivirga sp. S37H4]|uniref:Anthranilate synthase component I family protein n=1 Tax=Marivirga aurantiaca TaxID=2802615 RepID=A0A934WZU0_9BACT|nr:anthranilate synthase component I family protein [Marivirga aurantiaca]